MLKSMTGYGVAQSETADAVVRAELKTLNGKFLDVSVRLPRHYSEKEIELKSLISKNLQRGNVYLNISIDYLNPASMKKEINKALLMDYYRDLQAIQAEIGVEEPHLLEILLNLPEVLSSPEKELDEQEWQLVLQTLAEAIAKVNAFREQEGEALRKILLEYASNIERLAADVEGMKGVRLENIRERLRGQVMELVNKEDMDEGRLEQELIYYSEKLDITEELERLKSHIEHYRQSIEEDNPGKKLGFIAQEIGREINTIGSKANDANIQKKVVEMKDELEKIREQLLNIL